LNQALMDPIDFFSELKRRNVYKVAVAYAVVGWLLIQAASILLPTFEAPGWVMKVFVIVLAAGFVIALLIAWAFEMTPQGLKPTGEISPNLRLPYWSRRKFAAVMGLLALVATGLFIFQIIRGPGGKGKDAAAVPEKSIAVLPLVNQSGDPNQEYFSDGLSEELINQLGQIRELIVIGRNSSFHFKGKSADSRLVAQALGVANLLEGSVRKDGQRVRISVALVNALDGTQRWSQSYDRELKDIFALQTEIARSVADRLRVTLLGDTIRVTAEPSNQNLDAYNAYLQAEFYFAQFTRESTERSIEFYEDAIRLDPAYARAYGGLAWAFCRLGFFSGVHGRDAFTQARTAAERALSLSPDMAVARGALAYVHMNRDWNLAAADAVLGEAIQRAPNDPIIKNTLANLRAYQLRKEEALQLRRESVAQDPLNVIHQTNLAGDLYGLGRYDEAEAVARKALEIQPNAAQVHFALALIHIQRGQPDAALQEARLESGAMYRRMGIALAQAARGDQAAADEALRLMIAEQAQENPWRIAVVYAFRREPDKMFEWLDRAYALRDPRMLNLRSQEFFEPYNSDPRFIALCEKVGLPVPN
jgi:TolB-like protein/Flp pilus assembly protein TadD